MKNKIALLLILLLCLLVAACKQGADDQAQIVGTVNGDNITRQEYDQHYKILKISYEQQMAMQTGETVKLDEKKDKDTIKQLKDQAFNEMVLQELLWQQAADKKIEIGDKDVESEIKQDSYQKFIKDNGLDEKSFRQELKTQQLYWKLSDAVCKGVNVSDAEAKQYYEQNISEFQQASGVEIYHILVNTEKEANDILAQLQKGADFAKLAAQYSIDPGSKDQGGAVGLVNQDANFVPEFKTAALKLKPGELAPAPVKSEFGYHIIKAGEMKEAFTQSFDQVKNQITINLQNQKKDAQFQSWLQGVHEKADIKDLR